MPVAYFILILTAFIFNRLHFPFVNIITILGLIVLFADLITQLIRFMMKRIHISVFLASTALFFTAIGYTFMWLMWPAAKTVAVFGLIVSVAVVAYWLIRNLKPTWRFAITLVITMVLGVFVTMKNSSFYCMKNGIDPNNPVAPVFMKHYLAWSYNVEENRDAAMNMLMMEKRYLERGISEADHDRTAKEYHAAFKEDLLIVNNAVKDLSLGSWTNYQPLHGIDFQ